ncbi:MAG: hypothetical protein K1X35_14900, partial [Caulobacteraceae bacterium]|nr:hypothetical protein [Caulobacteraceae bacterium]
RGSPLASAEVTVNAVNDDGSDGMVLGKATTGPTGRFRVRLASQPTGAVRVTVTGGAHVSLWDERPIYSGPGKNPMSLHLDEAPAADQDVFVTPVSDLVVGVVRGKDRATALPQASAKARELIAKLFGFTGDPKPLFERTGPGLTCDPSATTGDLVCRGDLLRLWLLSIALEKTALDLFPDNRDVLYVLLSQDLDDQIFDGKRKAAPQVVYDKYTLPAEAGGKILASNCKTWYPPLQSADFKAALAKAGGAGTALKDAAMTTLDGMGQGLRVAAMGEAGLKADPPIYTSHGGLAASWINGRLWLFVPAGFRGIAALDITDPNARTREIKVWEDVVRQGWPEFYDGNGILKTELSTITNSGVIGVVPLFGADHPQLAAYSLGSRLLLINAENGRLEGTQELPLRRDQRTFGGASSQPWFNNTAAIYNVTSDGENGFWISNVDGYFYFDAKKNSIDKNAGYSFQMDFKYGTENQTAYFNDYPIIDTDRKIITQPFKYSYRDNRNIVVLYSGIFQIDMVSKKSYWADSLTIPVFEPELTTLPVQKWSPFFTCYDSVGQNIFAPFGVQSPQVRSKAGFIDLTKLSRTDGSPGTLLVPPESVTKTELDNALKGSQSSDASAGQRGPCLVDPNTRTIYLHDSSGVVYLNQSGAVARSWVNNSGISSGGLASIVYNRNTRKAYGYALGGSEMNKATWAGSRITETDLEQFIEFMPKTAVNPLLDVRIGLDQQFVKSFRF